MFYDGTMRLMMASDSILRSILNLDAKSRFNSRVKLILLILMATSTERYSNEEQK